MFCPFPTEAIQENVVTITFRRAWFEHSTCSSDRPLRNGHPGASSLAGTVVVATGLGATASTRPSGSTPEPQRLRSPPYSDCQPWRPSFRLGALPDPLTQLDTRFLDVQGTTSHRLAGLPQFPNRQFNTFRDRLAGATVVSVRFRSSPQYFVGAHRPRTVVAPAAANCARWDSY